MLRKITAVAGIALLMNLTGCANTSAIEEKIENLGTQVDAIASKVDGLSADVSSLKSGQSGNSADIDRLKSMVESAKDSADQANERLSNLVESYKK